MSCVAYFKIRARNFARIQAENYFYSGVEWSYLEMAVGRTVSPENCVVKILLKSCALFVLTKHMFHTKYLI
jgi:hypothetical protein